MDVLRMRLSIGEIFFAVLFVVSSALTWGSAAALTESPDPSPELLLTGLVLAGMSFTMLVLIEPLNPLVVHGGVVLGFLLAVPLAFGAGLVFGIPVAILAALMGELALWRARRTRSALRVPLTTHTAKRALPAYFSGVSVVLTAIVFLSPILARVVANPVPEPLVRHGIRLVDPLLRPVLGFSIQGTVDDVLLRALAATNPGVEIEPEVITLQREQYAARYEVEITQEHTLADVILQIIQKQAERFEERLASYYRIGFFLSAFFLFQLLSLPLSWLTLSLTYTALGIARATKAVRYTTRQEPRTVLSWNTRKTHTPTPRMPKQPPTEQPEDNTQAPL